MSANQGNFTKFDKGEEIVSATIHPVSGKLVAVTNDGRVLQLDHKDNGTKVTPYWKQLIGALDRD